MTRREAALACIAIVAVAMPGGPSSAADKVVKIGIDLSLTGADCRKRDPRSRTAP